MLMLIHYWTYRWNMTIGQSVWKAVCAVEKYGSTYTNTNTLVKLQVEYDGCWGREGVERKKWVALGGVTSGVALQESQEEESSRYRRSRWRVALGGGVALQESRVTGGVVAGVSRYFHSPPTNATPVAFTLSLCGQMKKREPCGQIKNKSCSLLSQTRLDDSDEMSAHKTISEPTTIGQANMTIIVKLIVD